MSPRTFRTFQALLLGALGIFLFSKVMDGRVLLYINQRFALLVLFGALALIILAQLVLRERPAPDAEEETHHDHSHGQSSAWGLFLLALPLLIGMLVPERPLGVQALNTRGVSVFAPRGSAAQRASGSLGLSPEQRSILDWLLEAADDPQGEAYTGQPADVSGFVFHDPRLDKDAFMVGRFTIACCVADASALGMVVAWPGAAEIPANRWVRVRGRMDTTTLEGRTVPLIIADTVEEIPEPDQPYLFP